MEQLFVSYSKNSLAQCTLLFIMAGFILRHVADHKKASNFSICFHKLLAAQKHKCKNVSRFFASQESTEQYRSLVSSCITYNKSNSRHTCNANLYTIKTVTPMPTVRTMPMIKPTTAATMVLELTSSPVTDQPCISVQVVSKQTRHALAFQEICHLLNSYSKIRPTSKNLIMYEQRSDYGENVIYWRKWRACIYNQLNDSDDCSNSNSAWTVHSVGLHVHPDNWKPSSISKMY